MKANTKGENNNNWKGGRRVTSHGYIEVRVPPEHPECNANGYAYEHRLVAMKKLGRKLRKNELVHHVDGDKTNNEPDNIEINWSIKEHRHKHRQLNSNKRKLNEKNNLIVCKCGCGTKFLKYDKSNRPRNYVSGHNAKGSYYKSKGVSHG